MKKALVILLALALVAGAFAQEKTVEERLAALEANQGMSTSLSGSATLSWGINLDNMATGFDNAFAATFKLKGPSDTAWLKKSKAGADDKDTAYGNIELGYLDIVLATTTTNTTNGTPAVSGAIENYTAKLVLDSFYVMFASRNDITGVSDLMSNLPILSWASSAADSGDVVDNSLAVTAPKGAVVGWADDTYTVELVGISDGNWTTNVNNLYAFGLNASASFADGAVNPTVNLRHGTLLAAGSKDLGLTINPNFSFASVMNGLLIDPNVDLKLAEDGTFSADAGLWVRLTIDPRKVNSWTQANHPLGNKTRTHAVNFYAYYAMTTTQDLDFKATYSLLNNPEGQYTDYVNPLGLSLTAKLYDVLHAATTDMKWTVDGTAKYDANGFEPYLTLGYGTDDYKLNATAGVTLYSKLTTLENTKFNAEWTTASILADATNSVAQALGTVIVKATISY